MYNKILLTLKLLKQQDDICSSAIIEFLQNNATFKNLSYNEGHAIVHRDNEDDEKLSRGIDIAIAKGLLAAKPDVTPATQINVTNLTAQQVADTIVQHLPSRTGNVIVVQGLSGTGKGTTVAKLRKLLEPCVTWSNGNVFRSYTYLCKGELKKRGVRDITPEALTPELLSAVEKRIMFEKCAHDGQFHILLDGTVPVGDIENTLLKTKWISEKVPIVAHQTQGEVIRFGAAAAQKLCAAGFNVVMEGRAQTLSYIDTDQRFELVIPDTVTLGRRRAAQRVAAKALSILESEVSTPTDDDVAAAVTRTLEEL